MTFHPGFAIRPRLLSPALMTIALAGAASAAGSTQETPAASACQVRLSSDRAVFKPLGELAGEPGGPAGCGVPDAVLLQRIILEDHTQVAATMRCEMAEAVTDFVRFSTVLGPGSDGYHEDHIHLDRIDRPSGYRLCKWELHDEPRFALQSVATSPAPSTPPVRAAAAAVRTTVPLPRPRPFEAAGARSAVLPAESHHR